jgi:hypothetical protein
MRLSWTGWRRGLVHTTVAAWFICLAAGAVEGYEIPADMPKTPFPDFKGCSSSQEAFLKEAWRAAHHATWRASKVLDHIMAGGESERSELWSRDYVAGSDDSISPRAWFGSYDRQRAEQVRDALGKARDRFEVRGQVVKGIGTVRCGQPIAPAKDENVDVCPGSNPGSSGPPSAYHCPNGTVVTCEKFWDRVNSASGRAEALENAVRTLVHEVFHWLSVDGKYVTDYHGDGVNGQPDQKYYGDDNAMYLASHKPSWAVFNNENYAYFARHVGAYEPTFTALFVPKEGSGTGGLYVDLSWESLVERWKALGDNQYLADVETYVVNGQRRYLAVWRIGKGNGALWVSPWSEFTKKFAEWKNTQDLIDVEAYKSGDTWMFLGVFRHKQEKTGDGGLLAGLTWQELLDKRKEHADKAYLADVEAYGDGSARKFIGVWRMGRNNGAFYLYPNWDDFAGKAKELSGSQQLADFEQFLDEGKWHYLGVWRTGAPASQLLVNLTRAKLIEKWKDRAGTATLVDVEEYTALPAVVK